MHGSVDSAPSCFRRFGQLVRLSELDLALAAVLTMALPVGAQVPDLVRIDGPGPFPDWSAADAVEPITRSESGAQPFGGNRELTASDIGSDLSPFPVADSADLDGIFRYRFVGEHRFSGTGLSMSLAGDVDCDGFVEVLVGAPLFSEPRSAQDREPGAAYLVSMADVEAADAADGAADGVIDLALVAARPRSWKLTSDGLHYVGTSVAGGGDVDGDGCSDILIGARAHGFFAGSAYVISAADLPAADAADGARDGVVDIRRVADQPHSWELTGEASLDNAGRTVLFAGDMNGDGLSDLLIGALFHGEDDRGAAYLLSGATLASADAADGAADGRIALASVAAQPDSWKLVGEQAKGLAGSRMAVANLDADGRPDLILAAYVQFDDDATGLDARGSVYLIAGADLPAIDAADGQSDGVIGLDAVASGGASWKLVGDFDDQRIGSYGVAAGDLDGDGVDNVVLSNFETPSAGRPPEVFAISVSDLPAADAADGTEDRVVALDSTLDQAGSFKLVWEGAFVFDIASSFDIDGDGLDDLLIGNESASEVSFCAPTGGARTNGAVALLPGGGLPAADAADGTADSVIDLHLLPLGDGFWKFVGAPTDRLGTGVTAGDIDGDGRDDPLLASFLPLAPYRDCGSGVGPGYVFTMSSAHMAAADAVDGDTDGTIHLEVLEVPWEAADEPLVFRQFDDTVIVVGAPEMLDYGLSLDTLVKAFLQHHGDVVDYLVVVTDLPASSPQYDYAGQYVDLRNSVAGIGKRVFSSRVYGQRLKGYIHLSYFDPVHFPGTLAHEIMHAWANFVIDAGLPHWGFSSANGVLGGFDPGHLVDLGDGRYTAGRFDPLGNNLPYSPIELYLAGLIPPDEVPELWVANDGAWSGDVDASGNRIFTASDVETWSIQRIVAAHGPRSPSWTESPKSFRAAVMLIVDDPASALGTAEELSSALRAFTRRGGDGDHGSYNFWEATGGRATLDVDSARRRGGPPEAVGRFPDARLALNDVLDMDVSGSFVHPDGDPLVYRATASLPDVVAIQVAGARVRVEAVGLGATVVGLTATDPMGLSAAQPIRVTVGASAAFSDDPARAGVTPIRAAHFLELRTRTDMLRRAGGLEPFGWTDPLLLVGVTPVRLAHLLDLRSALSETYAAWGRAAPSWRDRVATEGSGTSAIRAQHVNELRRAVGALNAEAPRPDHRITLTEVRFDRAERGENVWTYWVRVTATNTGTRAFEPVGVHPTLWLGFYDALGNRVDIGGQGLSFSYVEWNPGEERTDSGKGWIPAEQLSSVAYYQLSLDDAVACIGCDGWWTDVPTVSAGRSR